LLLLGEASGLVTITRWLLGFIVTLVFKDLMLWIGTHGTYWLFSGCCFVGGIYIYFAVPETKGKTLEEIQSWFPQNNQRKSIYYEDPPESPKHDGKTMSDLNAHASKDFQT